VSTYLEQAEVPPEHPAAPSLEKLADIRHPAHSTDLITNNTRMSLRLFYVIQSSVDQLFIIDSFRKEGRFHCLISTAGFRIHVILHEIQSLAEYIKL
jgi:hypothetical protein